MSILFAPLPEKKYKVILADVPWKYGNFSSAKHGAASCHYGCLESRVIATLPVASIAEENCALFLWITAPKLVEGAHLPLLWSWGFKPVTMLSWRKEYAFGKPYCGLGFYVRSRYEHIVFATRGKVPRLPGATNVSQEITGVVKEHSRKPDSIYRVIDQLYGPDVPKIELFARGVPRFPGWDVWGTEAIMETPDAL